MGTSVREHSFRKLLVDKCGLVLHAGTSITRFRVRPLGNFRLGTFTLDLSLGTFRLGTLALNLSFGNICLEFPVWDPRLGELASLGQRILLARLGRTDG